MAAAVAFAAILSMQPATAAADPVPAPAPDPGGAVAQARALSRQAEVITEQWKLATDRLLARQADAEKAHRDAAAATAVADQARDAQKEFRAQVDRLTSATFEAPTTTPYEAAVRLAAAIHGSDVGAGRAGGV